MSEPFASRLHDWEQRLRAVVDENLRRPYEFGKWDCLLWPAAAVKAVTGRDFGAGHRGKYRSQASAYRYLMKLGFQSPSDLLDGLFERKLPAFAGRGDIVLCHTWDGQENPGVVVGHFALVVGEIELPDGSRFSGLIGVARENWLAAWAVGEHHSGSAAHG